MFRKLFSFGGAADKESVARLYEVIVAAARQPAFYEACGVPDTPIGRFEMVSVHMMLFLRRISGEEGALRNIAQTLTDEFFLDVDHSLRELGIGDSGVPKRMKKLARMFYGRAKSYGEALDAGDEAALAAALMRNIRPESAQWDESRSLASYFMQSEAVLASQDVAGFLAGQLRFPQFQQET
jgi:cytochrome b pre-mRNA-processing protein 3